MKATSQEELRFILNNCISYEKEFQISCKMLFKNYRRASGFVLTEKTGDIFTENALIDSCGLCGIILSHQQFTW